MSLQSLTLAPLVADPKLFQQLASSMERTAHVVEHAMGPLRKLGASLALLAETEPRRRHLVAQLGTRNAHVARCFRGLVIGDAVAILDAIEHDAQVDARLLPLVELIRDALNGQTVTRRQLREAVRTARAERAPERQRRERRVDHRQRIEAGCTSRPRAPGRDSARLRAPARSVLNPRGSPV